MARKWFKWWIWIVPIILTGLLIFFGVFILSLLLIKVMWAWIMPDLLPGAVSQGLVAPSISWWTSFKLAIVIALLSSFTGARWKTCRC